MHNTEFPNISHPGVTAISIQPLYTVNMKTQTKVVEAIGQVWKRAKRPIGLLAGSVFNSENGESILIYLQWKNTERIRNMVKTDSVSIDEVFVEPFGNP